MGWGVGRVLNLPQRSMALQEQWTGLQRHVLNENTNKLGSGEKSLGWETWRLGAHSLSQRWRVRRLGVTLINLSGMARRAAALLMTWVMKSQ